MMETQGVYCMHPLLGCETCAERTRHQFTQRRAIRLDARDGSKPVRNDLIFLCVVCGTSRRFGTEAPEFCAREARA